MSVALLLILAQTPPPAPAPAGLPPTPVVDLDALARQAQEGKAGTTVTLLGQWSSEKCGNRPYARDLTIEEDGTYVGHDFVSPCPWGARCEWSGIVTYGGNWMRVDDTVILMETTPPDRTLAHDRPGELRFDGLVLREATCPWKPGPSAAAEVLR